MSAVERDDAALVAAVAQGDRTALEALYVRHAATLLAVGFRILHERQQAEGLVHDVMLEVWRTAMQFDPARGPVRTWLVIRMRSRCLDVKRSVRAHAHTDEETVALPGDVRSSAYPDDPRVRQAISDLGPDQKTVVELSYLKGMTCREIATRLDIPVGTVKSRLALGLRKLRQSLEGRGR